MEVLYPNFVHRQFTCYPPNDIISDALIIADTFNTALTHPQEWYSKGDKVLTPNKVWRKLEDAGDMLDTMYLTIKPRTKITNVDDIIHSLGECDRVLFFCSRYIFTK